MLNSFASGFGLQICRQVTTVAANLLLQTTFVLVVGLIAARMIRRRGVALQSSVLRATLLATLACPIASCVMYASGVSGFRLELAESESVQSANAELSAIGRSPLEAAESRPTLILETSDQRSNTDHGGPFGSSPRELREDPPRTEFAVDERPVDTVQANTAKDPLVMPRTAIPEPAAIQQRQLLRSRVYFAICIAWICASFVLFVRLLVAVFWMDRLRSRSHLAPKSVIDECREISQLMSVKAPPVLVHERLSSPCLLGWLRPAVMIPADLRPVSPGVLAHELAHLRRSDCFWNLLGHLATAVMPWQPLFWLLNRRMEQSADLVCDDYVVSQQFDRAAYARELVTIAERFPASWSSASAAVGIAEFQSCLGSRVQRIMDSSRSLSLQTSAKKLLIVAVVAVAGTLVAGLLGTSRNSLSAGDKSTVAALLDRDEDGKKRDAQLPDEKPITLADNLDANPGIAKDPGNLGLDGREIHPVKPVPSEREKVVALETGKNNPPPDQMYRFVGTVVDPEGKPVSNAKIFAVGWRMGEMLDSDAKPLAITDPIGHFEWNIATSDYDRMWRSSRFAAIVEGYGFAAKPSFVFETTGKLKASFTPDELSLRETILNEQKPVLQLVRDDVPLTGRIVNPEGQPVAGVRVRVTEVWYNKQESLDAWTVAAAEKQADYYSLRNSTQSMLIGNQLPSVVREVRTTDDGRFVVRGVGRERVANIVVSGANIELAEFHARTRKGETVVVPHQWGSRTDRKETYHGSDFIHVGATSVHVIGQITDIESGKPIEGVRVGDGYEGFTTMRGSRYLKAITDAEGRYRLEGLPVNKRHNLLLFPSTESIYLPGSGSVTTNPGQTEVVKDFQLRTGVSMQGRAVDARTGEPIPGHVTFYAFQSNEHLDEFPGFKSLAAPHQRGTDADGRFTIPVIPGAGILTFDATDHQRYSRGQGADLINESKEMTFDRRTYMTAPFILVATNSIALQNTDVPVGAKSVEVSFKIQSGIDVVGSLIDPAGNPVVGAIVMGEGGFGGGWYSLKGSTFKVRAFYPETPRTLAFYDPAHELAALYQLDNVPTEPLKITLQPSGGIRGRLIDEHGVAMSNVILSGDAVPDHRYSDKRQYLTTDDEGRFEIRGLVPGHKYTVTGRLDRFYYGTVLKPVSIDDARMKDLGDCTYKPKMKDE